MSARRISSKMSAPVLEQREPRLRHRPPGLLLERRPVELGDLHQVCEVEQAVDGIDLVVAHAEARLQAVEHLLGHRLRDLHADRSAESPPPELELDRFEQVVGLVRDLEVGIPRDSERRALDDFHLREERRERVGDHVLHRQEDLLSPDLDEPRQQLGDLHAREAHLAALRVADEHSERERERRDVRKGLARADRERCQDRIDLAVEALGELGQVLLGAVRDASDDDPFLRQRRLQLTLPELRLRRRSARGRARESRPGLPAAFGRRVTSP